MAADKREYGRAAHVRVNKAGAASRLFHGFKHQTKQLTVWMSHGDRVEKIPGGLCADRRNPQCAARRDRHLRVAQNFIGMQFHPEVVHSPRGGEIIANFLFRICHVTPSWTMASFAKEAVACRRSARRLAKKGRVVCGLSGGVDSSVKQRNCSSTRSVRALTCIFVDNGLLRQGERAQVEALFAGAFNADLRWW